jgi:hypothetical protein
MVSYLQGDLKYYYGLADRSEWVKDRRKRVEYLKRFWDRVQNKIDPNFSLTDPNNRFIGNLPVPGGKYPPGVSPVDIKEPEIRRQYEKALDENRQRGLRFTEQATLQRINRHLDKFVDNFLINVYPHPPFDFDELSRNLTAFEGERKEKIRETIANARDQK